MTPAGAGSPALALARRLLALDTINPPGNESAAAHLLGDLLAAAGYETRYFEFAPERTTLLASLPGGDGRPPLGFTGHLDTVPLGALPWRHDPFGGEVVDDRLYGRGASDMKAAVAAMVTMAIRHSTLRGPKAGILLAITAGEETSCEGARHLAESLDLHGTVGALVVGEPSENLPLVAHKGCVRYRITTRGVSAHGSMPELGVNAIHRMAEVIGYLRGFDFEAEPHPLLGSPTLNIGTIDGGTSINTVADAASIGVDIRLLPAQREEVLLDRLQRELGTDVRIERLEGAASVETDPGDPWIRSVFDLMEGVLGRRPRPAGVPYFTDASVLTAAFGNPPTVILGPGQPEMAHKTDEFCRVSLLETAVEVYAELARRWPGGA